MSKPSAVSLLAQRAAAEKQRCEKMVYKRHKTSNANSTNVTPQLNKHDNNNNNTDK